METRSALSDTAVAIRTCKRVVAFLSEAWARRSSGTKVMGRLPGETSYLSLAWALPRKAGITVDSAE